jgi:hypothetical protein
LHVARTDLEHVGDLFDGRDVLRVEHLGHDADAGLGARLGQNPQPLLAQALEGVWARARLVCAGPHQLYAEADHELRRLDDHLLVLDGAGARDDGEAVAHTRAGDGENAAVRVRLARDTSL